MNTIFSLRQAPSGRFLMILQTDERQKRVFGLISGQLVQPKQTRQQYPDSIWLEKASPSLLTKVQSPPTNDSLYFTQSNPLISYYRKSICYLLLRSALQTMQIRPPKSAKKPNIPTLLTPSQDFVYSSDCGFELIFFCYCIIQAYYLFLGILSPVVKVQSGLCCRGRVDLYRGLLTKGMILRDGVSSRCRESALNIAYNVN